MVKKKQVKRKNLPQRRSSPRQDTFTIQLEEKSWLSEAVSAYNSKYGPIDNPTSKSQIVQLSIKRVRKLHKDKAEAIRKFLKEE